MPVTTRSRARQQTENPPTEVPVAPVVAGPSRQRKGSPTSDDYNRELCQEFVDNPSRNPFTKAKIDFLGPRFMKLNHKCKRLTDIYINLNEYVEGKLSEDFALGYKLFKSINGTKMKNYFYDGKLVEYENIEYLRHAYNIINTSEYKENFDNYIIKHEGNAIKNGENGDLIIQLNFNDDLSFTRNGSDVYFDLHIGILDSLIGSTITVPTLYDDIIIKIENILMSKSLKIQN